MLLIHVFVYTLGTGSGRHQLQHPQRAVVSDAFTSLPLCPFSFIVLAGVGLPAEHALCLM
jgi:hypothetical protein